jgi:hypothetical protein
MIEVARKSEHELFLLVNFSFRRPELAVRHKTAKSAIPTTTRKF